MTNNQLQVFSNKEIGEIKGFTDKEGNTWVLAGSICRSLGLKDSKRQVKTILERFEVAGVRGAHTIHPLLESPGGAQKTLFVSEQVMYELIFQSRKQKAIKFRAWVTTEVLPALRKHGEYRMKGKMFRLNLTDSINESGENERMHGHAYSTYTRLIYKSLGFPSKVNRDSLTAQELEKLATRENLVQALVNDGLTYNQIKNVLQGSMSMI